MIHCYFAVENLALNDSQKNTLAQALRELGPESHCQPACLCHWRKRLDGDACIFEALFNEDVLTIAAFKQRLADIFGISVEDIEHSTSQQSFAEGTTPIVTFNYNTVNYLRMALFGGTETTWIESGDECRGYLKLYQDEWEPEQE